jgi:hypothetical protein
VMACVGALFVAAPASAAPVGSAAALASKSAQPSSGVNDVRYYRRYYRGNRYGYYRRGWPRWRSYPSYAYGYSPGYYPYYYRRTG